MPTEDDTVRVVLPDSGFLELHDEQVSAQSLLTEIRKRMAGRSAEIDYQADDFPEYSVANAPLEFPEDIPYSFALYYHLQRADELYAVADTGPTLAPSPVTRIPLIGRIWSLIRQQAHGLVLFYVNRHLAHETVINRHLIAALSELTRQHEEQQRTMSRLETRIARIEQEKSGE